MIKYKWIQGNMFEVLVSNFIRVIQILNLFKAKMKDQGPQFFELDILLSGICWKGKK